MPFKISARLGSLGIIIPEFGCSAVNLMILLFNMQFYSLMEFFIWLYSITHALHDEIISPNAE